MTAQRVKLDIDATRERLAALGLGYAVDALEGLLAEAVRAETPAHVFLDGLLEAERSGREERAHQDNAEDRQDPDRPDAGERAIVPRWF